MGFVFNGPDKRIELTEGTTSISIREMYSAWKEWVKNEGHSFSEAFSVVGGDPIDETNGIYITSYFFLINNWKIKPQAANHSLRVYDGVLSTDTGEDPFVAADGYWNIQIKYSQPIMSETIATGGEGSFTTGDRDQLNSVAGVLATVQSLTTSIQNATSNIPRRL